MKELIFLQELIQAFTRAKVEHKGITMNTYTTKMTLAHLQNLMAECKITLAKDKFLVAELDKISDLIHEMMEAR